MTRVLFIPNDKTVVFLDTHLTHASIAVMLEDRRWRPPSPYDDLMGADLRMIDQGHLVIILGPEALRSPAGNSGLLTRRQREILQMLADGVLMRVIAERLGVHPRTVDRHVHTLRHRLGAANNEQLIANAAALGLCRGE